MSSMVRITIFLFMIMLAGCSFNPANYAKQDAKDDATCGKSFPQESETYRICRAQLARIHALEQQRKPTKAIAIADNVPKAAGVLR